MTVGRDDVVQLLRQAIASGAHPVGSKLPSERELAERHGVSRSVVREALRTLSEQGFITIEPARGAFVRESRPTDAAPVVGLVLRRSGVTAREVIVARRVIEGENAALAALARTADDLGHMREALDDFANAPTLLDEIAADLALHTAVAAASGNQVLEAMFGSVAGFAAEIMLRSLGDPVVTDLAVPQHRQIVDAIEAHDADAARELMVRHIDVAQQHYGADLDRPLEAVARGRLADFLERLG
ncbi:FadR/GntR family transcriptional regulator [Brooklawnia cerclae]